MNPTDTPNTQNSQPSINNPLSAMQQGETVIFEIRRHPIGIFGVYLSFGLLLAIVAFSAIVAPNVLTDYERSMVATIGLVVFLFSVVMSLFFVSVAHKVYYGNRWILTTDSITQIVQNSLFSKQSSQLGLDNLEDVTVEQNGILTHMFNYGVLRSQTAGEHGKFMFTYCPRPNEYAQKILMARENFEHGDMYNGKSPIKDNN